MQRCSVLIVCIALFLAGCKESQRVSEQSVKVLSIEFEGLNRYTSDEVLPLLITKVGGEFKEEIWDRDWRKLQNSGMFEYVRMVPPITKSRGQIALVIRVVETKENNFSAKQASGVVAPVPTPEPVKPPEKPNEPKK